MYIVVKVSIVVEMLSSDEWMPRKFVGKVLLKLVIVLDEDSTAQVITLLLII